MDIGKLIATEDRTAVERWCRSQAQQAYVGNGRVLCRILGQLYCYVHGQDTALAPYLMLDGYWEMWVTQAVARYVKPGMTCVDVGASFGYYTLLLSELVGPKGYVQGFEPDADTVVLLDRSIQVNGFDKRARAVPVALADRVGVSQLNKPATRWSDAQLDLAALDCTPMPHVALADGDVMVSTLDAAVCARQVDFIKIDAEGSEPRIWAGMQGLLRRCDPVILMEFAPHLYAEGEGARFLAQLVEAKYPLRHVAYNGRHEAVTAEQLLAGGVDMLWLER